MGLSGLPGLRLALIGVDVFAGGDWMLLHDEEATDEAAAAAAAAVFLLDLVDMLIRYNVSTGLDQLYVLNYRNEMTTKKRRNRHRCARY